CSCPLPPQLIQALARAARGGPGAVLDRQHHAHTRATFGPIVGIDSPAVLLDDLLHDREPQSRALRLAGDVGVEYLAEELARKPRAIVTHGHDGLLGF